MAFKNMVIMVAEVWGIIDYLKETIKNLFIIIKPTNTTNSEIISTTTMKLKDYIINAIFWDFNKLSISEWRV